MTTTTEGETTMTTRAGVVTLETTRILSVDQERIRPSATVKTAPWKYSNYLHGTRKSAMAQVADEIPTPTIVAQ